MIEKKILKLRFYEYPGHGYLEVSRAVYAAILGPEARPSACSFHNGFVDSGAWFLEEDGDASEFVLAARRSGYELKFDDSYYNSRGELFSAASMGRTDRLRREAPVWTS